MDIDVFLENKPQQSRWYPGAGLYRHVHLVETDSIHIATFGILIRTPEIHEDKAKVEISIELLNGVKPTTAYNEGVFVTTDFFYDGQYVGSIESEHGTCNILNPHLWSPETPHLYSARTQVYRKYYGENGEDSLEIIVLDERSEERRVGKECRSRWSPYH